MLEIAVGLWGSVLVGDTLWGGMQADGKSDIPLPSLHHLASWAHPQVQANVRHLIRKNDANWWPEKRCAFY